jgi:uncharacterized RDD family membrane protein YckC
MDRVEPTINDKKLVVEDHVSHQNNLSSSSEDNHNRLNLASPRRRYLGQLLDMLTTWGVFITCLFVMEKLSISQDYSGVFSISLACIYLFLSDALPKGQSLGKRILSISVVSKKTGKYCTLWQSFLRNILTPFLGALDVIFILSKERQRIGDMLADTVVVIKD